MGAENCCGIQNIDFVRNIQDPTGQPVDPINAQGQLIQNISFDPHINFFKNQIQGVLKPFLNEKSKPIKNKNDFIFATTDKKQYQIYIQIVNNSIKNNQLSTTNVLTHLYRQVADIRERQEVETKFKNQKYAVLKCFVYLYTGNYAYRKVNQSLRTNQYNKLAPVIALIKKQLSNFSQQNSNVNNKGLGVVYRAIDTPDPLMIQKSRLYWRGFTSTAKNKDIIKPFGRYQYTIGMNQKIHHQYLIIPKQLSHFDEEQVLIFPFFYFQVIKVSENNNTKGQNYNIAQKPVQEERQIQKSAMSNIKKTNTSLQQKQQTVA